MPENLLKHVCPPTFGGGPLDQVPPDRLMRRNLLVNHDIALPPNVAARLGTDQLPMWIIENDDPDRPDNVPKEAYPSPLIRMVEGRIHHIRVSGRSGTHTIHWHGIEPVPTSDGVGKHSFEISGNYTYQFQPNVPGTFFYHCHKNTTLHFNMGLWGGLIIDPRNPNIAADNNLGLEFTALTPPYTTFGPGYVHARRASFGLSAGDSLPYHQEKIWAVDSLDSQWHLINPNHDLNMQDCDANDPAGADTFYRFGSGEIELNDFHPDVFTVTGVVMDSADAAPPFTGTITNPAIAITAPANQFVLLRYVNASYTVQELRLPVNAWVIAWDGHALGVEGEGSFNAPYLVPAGTPIRTTSARRMDIIIDTRGFVDNFQGFATIRAHDWVRGVPNGLVAVIRIPVNINGLQPGTDVVSVTRARFNPRTRRLEIRAQSSLSLPMRARVFAGDTLFNTFNLSSAGLVTATLPAGVTPTTVVVFTDQGQSPVTVIESTVAPR